MIKNNLFENYKKFTTPYPHIECLNFLQNFDSINSEFPKIEELGNGIRMHYDSTFGDDTYGKILNKSNNFLHLHNYVYSEKFIIDFLEIFKDEIKQLYSNGSLILNPFELEIKCEPYELRNFINKNNISKNNHPFLFPRMDIGVGLSKYGQVNGGRGPHVDNLTRLISILLYFTDQNEIVGGEHRFYKIVNKNDLMIDKVLNIKQNLLLASLQTNHSFHDVIPMISGIRKAIYFSVSCSEALWKDYDDVILKNKSLNRK